MIDLNEDTVVCPVCGKLVDECPHFNHEEEDYEPPSLQEETKIVMSDFGSGSEDHPLCLLGVLFDSYIESMNHD